jgi:F-type H+-transporting ATPase subunit a
MQRHLRINIYLIFLFFISAGAFASGDNENNPEEKSFDALSMIMHHISDSHYWHIVSFEKEDGSHVNISLPLPVILIYDGSSHIFMSSEFHHGEKTVKKGDNYFKLYHDKIYVTNSSGDIKLNAEGHPENIKPFDLSITRNVASMWLSVIIILLLFIPAAKKYKDKPAMPSGMQSILEPIILYIRDDIVVQQIGEKKADRFMPYILTVFFFIWINNLIGMVPFFPGGSNVSGNIAFTSVLAIITLLLTNLNGSKTYWKHIFATPGVPGPVRMILIPIEIVSIFTKPFALMIRLFANITAGHIIMLSLASLIFVLKSIYISPISIGMSLFMNMLELLVGLLQAYIFALLSALFIGMAIENEEH